MEIPMEIPMENDDEPMAFRMKHIEKQAEQY